MIEITWRDFLLNTGNALPQVWVFLFAETFRSLFRNSLKTSDRFSFSDIFMTEKSIMTELT